MRNLTVYPEYQGTVIRWGKDGEGAILHRGKWYREEG